MVPRPAAPRPRPYCQAYHSEDRSEQLPCRQRHVTQFPYHDAYGTDS